MNAKSTTHNYYYENHYLLVHSCIHNTYICYTFLFLNCYWVKVKSRQDKSVWIYFYFIFLSSKSGEVSRNENVRGSEWRTDQWTIHCFRNRERVLWMHVYAYRYVYVCVCRLWPWFLGLVRSHINSKITKPKGKPNQSRATYTFPKTTTNSLKNYSHSAAFLPNLIHSFFVKFSKTFSFPVLYMDF